MTKDLNWAITQIQGLRQGLKNTRYEYGFVLKALEEELKATGVVTAEALQKRVMHLNAIGWSPDMEETEAAGSSPDAEE